MKIKVMVQDQRDYGESQTAREVGEYSSRTAALEAARARLDRCLEEFYRPGINAEDLFQQWSLFGEDVFLIPDEIEDLFSASEYVRKRSQELLRR